VSARGADDDTLGRSTTQGTFIAIDLSLESWSKSATQYAVVVDRGFVRDLSGNDFEGIGPLDSTSGSGSSVAVTR